MCVMRMRIFSREFRLQNGQCKGLNKFFQIFICIWIWIFQNTLGRAHTKEYKVKSIQLQHMNFNELYNYSTHSGNRATITSKSLERGTRGTLQSHFKNTKSITISDTSEDRFIDLTFEDKREENQNQSRITIDLNLIFRLEKLEVRKSPKATEAAEKSIVSEDVLTVGFFDLWLPFDPQPYVQEVETSLQRLWWVEFLLFWRTCE